MSLATHLDSDAIARACEEHGVRRLRVFGSAFSDEFDMLTSDLDFLVDFTPGVEHFFDAYSGLRGELEKLLGRHVDLVIAEAVRNPYFAAAVRESAVDVYAA